MESNKGKSVCYRVIGALIALLIFITIIFWCGQACSILGRYYIPQTAKILSTLLCILWIAVIFLIIYLCSCLKVPFIVAHKKFVIFTSNILGIIITICLIWGCLSYQFGLAEKIEQYDENIALYVDNTFIRVESRHPYYRYEQNWMFMRALSEDELVVVSKKYGNSDDYYK